MEETTVIQPNDNSPKEKKDKKKKSKGYVKYILNILVVLIVTAVSVGLTVSSSYEDIVYALTDVKWEWIGAAIGVVAGAFLIRSITFWCFARLYTKKYHLHQAVAVDQIGIFYNAVTPGASGGQFMQAYTYKKQGLPISAGASIMVMSSIVYQMALIVYGVLALSINYAKFAEIPPLPIGDANNPLIAIPIIPLVIVGFLINVAYIGVLLLMSYSKGFHHFILGPFINFLALIHLVKDKDKTVESLRIQVENFKIELKRLLSNIPFFILIFVLNFLVLTLLFSVPYYVGRALGSENEYTWSNIWQCIFMSNFHQMVTGLIPIPGSAGVSELFFSQLFNSYFTQVNGKYITAAAQLIWRTITFTLPLVIAGLVSAFYKASPKEQINEGEINRKTFVNLQRETFVEREASASELYETKRLTRAAIMDSLKKRDKQEKDEIDKKEKQNKEKKQAATPLDDVTGWNEIDIGEDDDE